MRNRDLAGLEGDAAAQSRQGRPVGLKSQGLDICFKLPYSFPSDTELTHGPTHGPHMPTALTV